MMSEIGHGSFINTAHIKAQNSPSATVTGLPGAQAVNLRGYLGARGAREHSAHHCIL